MTDPAECPTHPDTCCDCPPTHEALRAAAELLERAAIGDEPEGAARTVALLIGHALGRRFEVAPHIALMALLGCAEQNRPRVAQAVTTLRIELPV